MLRIRLVGELRLDLDGRELGPVASRRARSLLAWLAYHPGLHSRGRVASVFWPDVLDSSARASLRTTLATLRRDLGEDAARHIVAGRDRVGVEEVWVDIREIDRLAADGRHAEALALADGDLLTDLDDDWVHEERRVRRDRVLELLAILGQAAEDAGDLTTAVQRARRRLELDAVSEEAARVLMRRLAQSGDGAAAVTVYEAFRSALQREHGMAPSAETRALVEELRSDRRRPARDAPVAPLPPALARAEHAPLVGRGEQLASLGSAWRRASAGAGAVVAIAGEAGSGKTRLLTELAGIARGDGATVLAGRCIEDGIVAFAPFTEALRPYVAGSLGGLPDWVAAELARLLPELGAEAGTAEGEPQDARHRLFEAVAAAVGHAARRTPVLLVLEDLHWADPATLGMLAHVIRTVGWAPLLVAGSLRDERTEATRDLRALLDDLQRERRLERVALPGLSESEVGDLVGAWIGNAPVPPGLTAAVNTRTRGNPLFVEELVRHLVESHAAEPIEALVDAAATDVPHGVRSVIDRRLARLPDGTGRAVRTAAVAGEDFALADIASACECGDDRAAEDLDVAVGAGLVDESGVAGRYRFAHALVREAVLAALAPTRRALLHRRMAEVLQADERRLREVARHMLDARPLVDAATAASMALRAAGQATARLAYEDAAELLERALMSDFDVGDRLRAELLLALGDAQSRAGDAPSGEVRFGEAADAARSLGDPELLARAALGRAGLTVTVGPIREDVRALLEEALTGIPAESPLRPRLLARLAIEVYYAEPATLREELSDEALTAGRRLGGRALLEALGARHVALWSPPHGEERLRIADELVAAARSMGDREAELQGVNWRITDLLELCRLDAARTAIDEHERLAGDLRLLGYAWYAPLWRAMLAMLAGRLDEAWQLSEEGARIGRAAQDPNAALLFGIQQRAIRNARGELTDAELAAIEESARHRPAGPAWRVWAAGIALNRGEVERARRAILQEVDALGSLPRNADWLYTAAALGVQLAYLGEAEAAAVVYPLLVPHSHRMVTSGRASSCMGSASLSLGLLARTMGDRPAAIAHLEEAVRQNDGLGAVPYAAFARHALADLVDDEERAAALRREAQAAADLVAIGLPDGLLSRH